jgi:hypothetical protein
VRVRVRVRVLGLEFGSERCMETWSESGLGLALGLDAA